MYATRDCRRATKIRWVEGQKNEEVLRTAGEERILLKRLKRISTLKRYSVDKRVSERRRLRKYKGRYAMWHLSGIKEEGKQQLTGESCMCAYHSTLVPDELYSRMLAHTHIERLFYHNRFIYNCIENTILSLHVTFPNTILYARI